MTSLRLGNVIEGDLCGRTWVNDVCCRGDIIQGGVREGCGASVSSVWWQLFIGSSHITRKLFIVKGSVSAPPIYPDTVGGLATTPLPPP